MITGIYIHIPFCSRRCYYCDFFSVKTSLFQNKDEQFEIFINALTKEIELYSEQFKSNRFSTLYIGGGTPSILPVKYIDQLFSSVFKAFSFDNDIEFTIEVNPESIDSEKLLCYSKWRMNRISLGCQTFNDTLLKAIGRSTSAKEIIDKYNLVRSAGFDNISLDLIFGLVNQRVDQYKYDLKYAVSLKPEHLSTYNLTLGRKTLSSRIDKGILTLPCENSLLKEYLFTLKYLEKNKYQFYEVSNFALEGRESRHNLNYWWQKDYLGLGPSACGTVNKVRYINDNNLKSYITLLKQNKLPIVFSENLDSKKLRAEMIMLSLRTKYGLNLDSLKDLCDESWYNFFQNRIFELISMKLLIQKGNYIYATKRGILILNTLITKLI